MKPLICAPMGDPAGVGPEILAASLADATVQKIARVLVVGNTEIMRHAAAAMKVSLDFNQVDQSLEDWREGAVNIINMDNVNLADFAYGKVQAQCGRAAFEYIKASIELTMAGKTAAVATTPINKESLKAAGVPYIGHTEIFGDLTGTKDPLTMFQVHNLRVFFLTRHLSLMDACRAVKKDRVLDYIARCSKALHLLGIENPSMVVAGLNPHCGEHGLFGNEEDLEVAPAIEEARQQGFNAHGPNPADSVFHFALKGTWDAVLSLYHDQGHIATKMVDFERTISLTLGMPILRTSVDHGTAFEIAGTGKVSAVSMVEAIRLAAEYAPGFKKAQA
jgi:4-phospho-D-threonate 3-dehydrogenase / 4-phospho-D-erythronate 3-dehydrogenase